MALLTAAALATAVSLTSVPAPAAAPTYAKIGDGTIMVPNGGGGVLSDEWTLYYLQGCQGSDIWEARTTAVIKISQYKNQVLKVRLDGAEQFDGTASTDDPGLVADVANGCGSLGTEFSYYSEAAPPGSGFSFKVVDAQYLLLSFQTPPTNVRFSVHRCTSAPNCPVSQ